MLEQLLELKTKVISLFSTIKTQLGEKLDKTAPAVAANKFTDAITLTLSGDTEASAQMDGSADVVLSTTLSATGVAAGTYTKLTVDAKGRVTAGAILTVADIPDLDTSKITTGVLPTARGGTGGDFNMGSRNVFISTSPPTGGNDGDIWLQYI